MNPGYDRTGDIEAARTSRRWATLGLSVLCVIVLVLIWLFVDSYYGADGVRLVGIILGIALLIAAIIGIGVGVMFVASGMTMRHHDNVLGGIVAFQREDDRGEVARTVASGVAGVLRSGNQLDRTVLTMAGRMAQGQTQAMLTAQRQDDRQQLAQAEQDWYQVPAQFDETPSGW